MQRICEPELMGDPIQARIYAQTDFHRSDRAFTDRILALLSRMPAPAGRDRPLRIVDLGCGPGNISFRLADALPGARLLGLDGAAAMLAEARARRDLEPARWPQLRFAQVRLPPEPVALAQLPRGWEGPFDLLVSNSLLHHLHDPAVLWRTLAHLAAPGALFVLRDLRRPLSPAVLRSLVRRHAGRAAPVLRRDFANSLRAAFQAEEVRRQLAEAGLAALEVRAVGDRYLDVWGRLNP